VPQSHITDVHTLVLAAGAAFETYGAMPPARRAEFLRAIADQIDAARDTIVPVAMRESNLPEARLIGETGRTTGQLRFFAAKLEDGRYQDARIDAADPERKPLPKPDVRSMLLPIGPVAVFGASNFPLAFSVAGGDTASALAAGCPVIVKAHPAHPETSALVADCIAQAAAETRMPNGTFGILYDEGFEIGQALVRAPGIAAVAFTGSQRGGLALAKIAAEREIPIPVYAEMGSVNPVFVAPRYLERNAATFAKGLAASVTMGVGQFCTNPGLVVPFGSGYAAFRDAFVAEMQAISAGTMLTHGIAQAYCRGAEEFGAELGVKTLLAPAGAGAPAVYELDRPRADVPEIFGPATVLAPIAGESFADFLAAAGEMEGQLTCSVFADADDESFVRAWLPFATRIAGRAIYGQFPTGVEVCDAMVHGGPFPATIDGRSTSVGGRAVERFLRPVAFQGFPTTLLPTALA